MRKMKTKTFDDLMAEELRIASSIIYEQPKKEADDTLFMEIRGDYIDSPELTISDYRLIILRLINFLKQTSYGIRVEEQKSNHLISELINRILQFNKKCNSKEVVFISDIVPVSNKKISPKEAFFIKDEWGLSKFHYKHDLYFEEGTVDKELALLKKIKW